jgi:3-oxoadipate enol-lactonase
MDLPPETYKAQLSVIQTHDATDRLGQIRTPTLVIAGEEDILIPVRLSKRLQEGIPNAEWTTTTGGHACLWEHPKSFNETFLAFVEKHRGQR